MINFTDMLVFTGMLFLRFGVPLLVVIGIGYLLKRLDRRWEAERGPSRRRPRRLRFRPSSRPRRPRGRCAGAGSRACAGAAVHPAAGARNAATSARHDDGAGHATMLRR